MQLFSGHSTAPRFVEFAQSTGHHGQHASANVLRMHWFARCTPNSHHPNGRLHLVSSANRNIKSPYPLAPTQFAWPLVQPSTVFLVHPLTSLYQTNATKRLTLSTMLGHWAWLGRSSIWQAWSGYWSFMSATHLFSTVNDSDCSDTMPEGRSSQSSGTPEGVEGPWFGS